MHDNDDMLVGVTLNGEALREVDLWDLDYQEYTRDVARDWENLAAAAAPLSVGNSLIVGGRSVAIGSVRAATENWNKAIRQKQSTLAATYREPSHVNWGRVRREREAGRRLSWANIQRDFDRKGKEVK